MRRFATGVGVEAGIGVPPLTQLSLENTTQANGAAAIDLGRRKCQKYQADEPRGRSAHGMGAAFVRNQRAGSRMGRGIPAAFRVREGNHGFVIVFAPVFPCRRRRARRGDVRRRRGRGGGGGIGIVLYSSINQFAWHEVSVILAAILGVVVVSEFVSATVRRRIT